MGYQKERKKKEKKKGQVERPHVQAKESPKKLFLQVHESVPAQVALISLAGRQVEVVSHQPQPTAALQSRALATKGQTEQLAVKKRGKRCENNKEKERKKKNKIKKHIEKRDRTRVEEEGKDAARWRGQLLGAHHNITDEGPDTGAVLGTGGGGGVPNTPVCDQLLNVNALVAAEASEDVELVVSDHQRVQVAVRARRIHLLRDERRAQVDPLAAGQMVRDERGGEAIWIRAPVNHHVVANADSALIVHAGGQRRVRGRGSSQGEEGEVVIEN